MSLIMLFRIAGQICIALLALLFPEVGQHRYLLAGVLLLVCVPLTIFLNARFRDSDAGWVEPLFDLVLVVVLVHFVPDVWMVALCIGLMVALAPSVSLHPLSYRIYGLFAVILIGGMALAASAHGVDDWLLPLLAVAAIYPSVVFYAHWQVRRADALRERSQLLQSMTHLAGSVAHDFNNVLAGVTGHAELALAELPDDHPANAAVREVINGASRASLLCGQLLSFSKLVPGSQQLDLKQEIRTLVGLLEPVVPKGVRIEFEQSPSDVWVHADRSQLQQVIMNVILNAGEASADVPAVVEVSLLTETEGAGWAVIKVRDRGDGIADEDLERVFDPFYTTKEKGHGLGLAGARRIMLLHGGEVSLASRKGVGTTVTLRLPLAKPDPDVFRLQEADAAPVRGEGGLVMVVDDETSVREVVGGLLERSGYGNLMAENGQEAVELFRDRSGDLAAVMLDIKMPGMDGWRCLELLREIRSDIPVLVCSGYDPEDRAVVELPENVRFLHKPFRNVEMQAALSELLSRPDSKAS